MEAEEIPEIIKEYVLAKQSGTLHQYYLERFMGLRWQRSDELPQVDVRSIGEFDDEGFKDRVYKCRGNYIVGLSTTLQSAISNGIFGDSQLLEKIRSFRSHDFNFHHKKPTSKEEIQLINDTLDLVIAHIENRISPKFL